MLARVVRESLERLAEAALADDLQGRTRHPRRHIELDWSVRRLLQEPVAELHTNSSSASSREMVAREAYLESDIKESRYCVL